MAKPVTEQPRSETDYGVVKSMRFREEDAARLQALAKALGVSEAAVVRMAIRELARREGLE